MFLFLQVLYLFVVCLTSLSVNQAIQCWRIRWQRIRKCKGSESKQSWPTLRYFPVICLDVLRKTTKNLMSVRVRAKIQICTSLIQVRRVPSCAHLIIGNRRFPHQRNLNAHFDYPMLSSWPLIRNTRARFPLYFIVFTPLCCLCTLFALGIFSFFQAHYIPET